MKLMRVLAAAIAAAVFLTHGTSAAQSTAGSQVKKDEEIPPVPTASGPPPLPDLSQLDEAFKQTSMGTTADELRRHAEWRRLENQVVNDPAVVAAKKAAETAHTDLEKRKLLSNYYDVYYKRMEALAQTPEMKAALDGLRTIHMGMVLQPRVRPTPTLSPTATPTASPVPPTVHIEPPLPSAAPSPGDATALPAPNPAILPTPIPAAGVIPSPVASPSPTATGTP